MPDIFGDFPSIKLLLLILCGIGIFGIMVISRSVEILTTAFESLRENLIGDLPNAIHDGIAQMEKEREVTLELDTLRRESEMLTKSRNDVNSSQNSEAMSTLFNFSIDAEATA